MGFVTHGWLRGTCREAWLRTPTVVGLSPPPPVVPVAVTVADVTGTVGNALAFFPIFSGGTGPYTSSYDYGDGQTGTSNQHAYANAGAKQATGKGTCKATIGVTPGPGPGPAPGPYPLINIAKPGDYYFVPAVDYRLLKNKADTLDSIRDLLVPGNGGMQKIIEKLAPVEPAKPQAPPPEAATRGDVDRLGEQLQQLRKLMDKPQPKNNDAALQSMLDRIEELRRALPRVEVKPGAKVAGPDGSWQPLEKFVVVTAPKAEAKASPSYVERYGGLAAVGGK